MSRAKRKKTKHKKRVVIFVVIVLLLLVCVVCGYLLKKSPIKDNYSQTLYPKKYEEYVTKYTEEYSVDQYIVYAMIKQESNFDPEAVSIDKARGLMQLTEDTFDWIKGKLKDDKSVTFDDMFDPETNIRYGVYLISYLEGRYETFTNIVVAYHAGLNITAKWLANEEYSKDGKNLDVIPYKDTEFHVKKVSKYYDEYINLYENNK